jgi:hypothetical protein
MKKISLLLAAAILIIWTVPAAAEPIAALAPLNSFAKQSLAAEGKTEADMLNDVPPKELVGIPGYPGSYFGGSMGTDEVLTSVTIMSKDSPEKVVKWYADNLGSSWRSFPDQVTSALKEVSVFIKTDKKTIDAMDAMKLKQVRISKVESPTDTGFASMMFDVTGIKTMINITVTPLM